MGKLGYSSITLTDLTETLPISLILENTSSYTTQTKIGELYSPNFNEKGLIITPSFFRGNEEIKITEVLDFLQYEVNVGEEQFLITKEKSVDKISIDEEGRLIYQKNLTANLTIKALVSNYIDNIHNIKYETIRSTNSIVVLFLEHGNNAYIPIIESDGREHFEESNQTDITLTAKLYYNGEPIDNENLEFLWDKISDVDDGTSQDFSANTASITIQRSLVGSTQIYSCRITDKITKIDYFVSKIIRDFTDIYNCVLIADSSLILTPENEEVNLECQLWHGSNLIIDENISYEWHLLLPGTQEDKIIEGQNSKILKINVGLDNNIFPQSNFSIFCKVIRNGSVSLGYTNISYSPIEYSVEITPLTIFLPVTSKGAYKGKDSQITKDIIFKLVDKTKTPIPFVKNDKNSFPFGSNFTVSQNDENAWDFTLTLNFPTEGDFWQENIDSTICSFSYLYLGQQFTEEIQIIKNYAGDTGETGTGYSILLTNEALTLPGSINHSVAGMIRETKILTFRNTEEIPAILTRIGDTEISGDSTSLDIKINDVTYFNAAISNNNSSEISLSLTTTDQIGEDGLSLPLYIVIDEKTFIKYLSFAVAFKGATGAPGNSYQIKVEPTVAIYKISNGIGSFVDINGEIISEMKATAYYYNETSTTPQVFSNGFFHFYGAVQAGDWMEISKTNSTSGSFSYTDIINLLSYRYFKYQLTNEDESIIYDEQSVPVLREGYLYGGQNLLLDSERTIEISAESGEQTGIFYLISSLNKNTLFGQDLTLSFERYFPKGTRVLINNNATKNFGMWLTCRYNWVKNSNEIIQQINYLLEDLNYENIESSDRLLERISGTINLVKPSSFSSGGITYTQLNDFDCWVQYKMNYYTVFQGEGESEEQNQTNAHLSYPKLETGAEPTMWSPAQEDVSFGAIQGTNLIESSYKKIIDNGENLFSYYLQQVGDYTLSWKTIEGEALIQNSDISLSTIVNSNSVNFLTFKNTKANSELKIQPTSSTGSVTFTQIKLEKGDSATSWLLSDSDIQTIIQEAQALANQYTNNQLDKDNLIKVIGLNGEMVAIQQEEWENIRNVTQTVVAADGGAALSSFLKSYIASGQSNGSYKFNEVMSRIILNYDENGTPYLQMSMDIASEGEESLKYSMKLTNDKLSFCENNKELAYFSSSRLYVSSITAYKDIIFGQKNTGGIIFTAGQTGIGISRIQINDSRFP